MNTRDVVDQCILLARNTGLTVTVNSSAKGGLIIGAAAMFGSLALGPVGFLIGGGLLSLGAFVYYRGTYRSVYEVIEEMNEDERQLLREALLNALRNIPRIRIIVSSCHAVAKDQINIHLVPHTHDDMGWLKTVDQYYYGTHKEAYSAGVKFILDSMVDALQQNSDRRFIYVEMGFFFKWWIQQSEETKNTVKKLVNNGQLEFISGGWSMNDEAGTYYQTIIDQMSLGLRRLNETFGECGRPKVAWQIDPFGHSREMASIFAQLGFDGFFLNRIDYQDLDNRRVNRSMEFVWRGSPDNLGESTDIYTNVLFRHYSAPSGLCFDILCNDDNIVDDENSVEYNVDQKAENFINDWVVPASKVYSSNNILVPMGDDFMYQYAQQYFENIDKLIRYINGRTFNGVSYNIIYSTPSCYLNAVYQATNGTLEAPLKTDDFFPLASSAHNYWTGYFTSRPTGKGYSRYANNFLQVCKQLTALTNITTEETQLNVLREALGVFQHHDAITGTEKENVARDYIKLMHNGIVECEEITNNTLFHLTGSTNITFTTCPMLNISECARTENEEKLVITVYNPLGRSVNKYVRLPVVDNTTKITITDPNGTQLVTQIIPIHRSVFNTPGRDSKANFELVFRADNVPPLGFKSYYFEKSLNEKYDIYETSQENLETDFDKIRVSSSSSPFGQCSRSEVDFLTVITSYYYYTGFVGNDSSDEFSSSNQYIFRPDPEIPLQPVSTSNHFELYDGPLIDESHWYCNDWFSYVIRNYLTHIEFNYLVGPLPLNQNKGIEVVVRFQTNLDYDDNLYMDTNGRERIERIRDYRPTWNVSITEPIAGNYYPVVSGITAKNASGSAAVTFLTDRANGGGSMKYQDIELMIHRSTIKSLGGVGPLDEQGFDDGVVTRGSHYLIFGGTDYTIPERATPKELSQEIYLGSWIFFASPNGLSFEAYSRSHSMEFSGLTNLTLPRNVHILTLEPWGPSTLLLRLENFVGIDDEWHSGTSTVNVKQLFSTFDILTIKETTLGGNQWLDDSDRIRFNKQKYAEEKSRPNEDEFEVILDPMQIRTFILTITYK